MLHLLNWWEQWANGGNTKIQCLCGFEGCCSHVPTVPARKAYIYILIFFYFEKNLARVIYMVRKWWEQWEHYNLYSKKYRYIGGFACSHQCSHPVPTFPLIHPVTPPRTVSLDRGMRIHACCCRQSAAEPSTLFYPPHGLPAAYSFPQAPGTSWLD